MATLSGATRAKLEHLAKDLQGEFPAVSIEEIDATVEDVTQDLLVSARFHNYVPLLAQRHARERLRGPSSILEPV